MYLISAYFDENTSQELQRYIHNVANSCGNDFMISNNVPPHLTLCAVEAKSVDVLIPGFESLKEEVYQDKISIVTVGVFMPKVLYFAPYINEYLFDLQRLIYNRFSGIPQTTVSPFYRPFSWFPHITVAKTLSKEQMTDAINAVGNFRPMDSKIVRLGLAKVNPHMDVREIVLKKMES